MISPIPIAKPLINQEETKAVNKAIKSGWITMGKKVKEFEALDTCPAGLR